MSAAAWQRRLCAESCSLAPNPWSFTNYLEGRRVGLFEEGGAGSLKSESLIAGLSCIDVIDSVKDWSDSFIETSGRDAGSVLDCVRSCTPFRSRRTFLSSEVVRSIQNVMIPLRAVGLALRLTARSGIITFWI